MEKINIIEVICYLLFSGILSAYRRVLSGKKNGCFYAKGNKPISPELEYCVNNLHFVETPAWYFQFGSLFFTFLLGFRILNTHNVWWIIAIQIVMALIASLSCSGLASKRYQHYINVGSNLPEDWDFAKNKSEFAIKLFGKKISFWWTRPFGGKNRKFIPYISGVILAAIITLAALGIPS